MRSSIVVVSYNSRRYLQACLDSILADMTGGDEVIVVDNGSTDGSADIVAEQYPSVHLIRGENVGYAGGNNRGAAVARGRHLLFLNPDTIIHPGTIEALVAPLEQPGDVALTTARIVFMDRPEIVNTCGNTVQFTGLAYCRGAGQPAADYAQPAEVDAVSGAAFAIRRAVFEELEGFDASFFMYLEDTDLSWRAWLLGYRCRYVPEAVVEHDYRISYSQSKAFFLERNRHLMLLKNLSRAMYLRMLPGLLLAELVTWGFFLLKGPRYWSVKPRVLAWLWRNRHTISAPRRAAQQERRMAERKVLARMAYGLDFRQLANPVLSHVAEAMFNPAFRLAQHFTAAPTGS